MITFTNAEETGHNQDYETTSRRLKIDQFFGWNFTLLNAQTMARTSMLSFFHVRTLQ